jgi:hypothetical protein
MLNELIAVWKKPTKVSEGCTVNMFRVKEYAYCCMLDLLFSIIDGGSIPIQNIGTFHKAVINLHCL